MEKLTINTRAKINLTLDIINKREDGYHNLNMIMQSIDLFDTIHFQKIDEGITLSCNHKYMPTDNNNIIYRAASLLKEKYDVSQGVKIELIKKIPIQAGLGGGSSNAAGTLRALNELWELSIDDKELLELSCELGADVPFCIMEGTALAEGIGEILTPVRDLPRFYVLLVKPPVGISTPWAYSKININDIKIRPDSKRMIEAINTGDRNGILKNIGNVFEKFIFPHYPELNEIKREMAEVGALAQLMSGSGPTIFGLYQDENTAREAKKVFQARYKDVFLVRTYNKCEEE